MCAMMKVAEEERGRQRWKSGSDGWCIRVYPASDFQEFYKIFKGYYNHPHPVQA
jgi:hypothetical protein